MTRGWPWLLALLALSGCGNAADEPLADAESGAVRDTQPAPPPAPPEFGWDRSVGMAAARGDTLCLRVRDPDVPARSPVLLISTATPQDTASAAVAGKLPGGCPDEPPAPGYSFYRLEDGAPDPTGLWIAVVHPRATPVLADSVVRIDLDADGRAEEFRECASMEGVHLTIWGGPPLESPRRWHYYYYLGYDVEPTCTDEEATPDGA